jgi:hypothetical protein
MSVSRNALLSLVLPAIAVILISCQKHPAQTETPVEPYIETAGAAGFDIIPLASSEGAPRWMGVYTDEGRTTKFSFEPGSLPTSDDASAAPSMGKGRFVAEEQSDPLPLLNLLKKALQAKHVPSHTEKEEDLPFSYLLLGENQSRAPDGSFSSNPKGNWTTTKIFLANDTAEVYFNFNPVNHKAEFGIKDAKFGDRVLAELAKVF